MSTACVLERLERADGGAELLAGLEVFDRERVHLGHAADRFRGERRQSLVHHALHERQGVLGFADHAFGADAHVGERDLRRALPVLRGVAPARNVGVAGIHEEEADAGAVAAVAGDAGGHESLSALSP
jgi:hypothetical protein